VHAPVAAAYPCSGSCFRRRGPTSSGSPTERIEQLLSLDVPPLPPAVLKNFVAVHPTADFRHPLIDASRAWHRVSKQPEAAAARVVIPQASYSCSSK